MADELAGEPITNEMAEPPNCDRDKLICPYSRWASDEMMRLRTALREIADPLTLKVEGIGMERALKIITKMQAIARQAIQ